MNLFINFCDVEGGGSQGFFYPCLSCFYTHTFIHPSLDLEVFMKLVEYLQLFRIRGRSFTSSSTPFSSIATPPQPHSSTCSSKQDNPPTSVLLFLLQVRFVQRKAWMRLSPSDAVHFQVYHDGHNSPSFVEFSPPP